MKSYWFILLKAVLRSSKVRNAGLKYLSKRLPKLKAEEEEDEKMDDDSNSEEEKNEKYSNEMEKKILNEEIESSSPSNFIKKYFKKNSLLEIK